MHNYRMLLLVSFHSRLGGNMKSYLDQYFEAFSLPKTVGPTSEVKALNIGVTKNVAKALQHGEFRKDYDDKAIPIIKAFAELYLKHRPAPIAHNCHAVSDGFLKTWESTQCSQGLPLTITIGNVWFRNQNIYGATAQTVLDLLSEGPVARKKLPVHVWLTLDDMTVFDLTILALLPLLGSKSTDQSSVLVWRDGVSNEFSYEPLLIHNGFFGLVDTGRTEVWVAPES